MMKQMLANSYLFGPNPPYIEAADPHLAQVGTSCERCHGDSSWAPSRFDHNRDSTYRLEGAHRAVACIGCHVRERISGKDVARLKPLGSACADCHKSTVQAL